jgi:hypothetical protein
VISHEGVVLMAQTVACAGRSITIRGITYKSQASAARKLGVSSSAITMARQAGRLSVVGLRVVQSALSPEYDDSISSPATSVMGPVQRVQLHKRLLPVFHPHWCAHDDHALLVAKASGEGFASIAGRLGRPCVAIEQRWHRLRGLTGIINDLEAYGLSDAPYSIGGAGAHIVKAVSRSWTRDQLSNAEVARSDGENDGLD